MASEWNLEPLEELCLLINRGIAPSYTKQGGLLVINQKCIRDQRVSFAEARRTDPKAKRVPEERLLQPFDVLVNSTGVGTLGRVAQVKELPEPATVDSHVTIVRPDPEKIFPPYLGFVLRSKQLEIEALAEGSTGQTELSRARLRELEIPVPPFSEQRAIAHVLGTLDDKIELLRRMNETLEAMARALFKSWFVDFDPVIDNALDAGNPIPNELKEKAKRRLALGERRKPLPEHIRRLFPDRFVDSELGPIPEGWRVGQLGDLVGFLSGYAYKSKDWRDKGVPVIKIGSVKPGIVDLNTVSYVSDEVAAQTSRYRLNPGDLLIGMTGYVGEVGLVPPTDNPPLLNQRVGKFVLEKNGTESLGFIYCLTRRPQFKAEVKAKSHGTAQANVSAKAILSIAIISPPKPLRELFDRVCKPILDRILNNWAESRALAALRDALLPKLISGEIQVKDAERFLKERGV